MLLNAKHFGRAGHIGLYGCLIVVSIFLLAPIIFLGLLSLGSSPFLIFPPPHWTFKWYLQFFTSPDWLASIMNSLEIAAGTAVLATILGVPASFGLIRGNYPGKKILNAYFMLPMIIPVIVIAIAIYSVFLKLGLTGTYIGFVLAHTVLALPFVIICVTTALRSFNHDIERAAIICGVPSGRAKVTVTLRTVLIGVLSGTLFAFLISWDEVVIAMFMSSPTLQTLPIKMWSTLRLQLNPLVAVAGVLLALLSVFAMASAALAAKFAKTS